MYRKNKPMENLWNLYKVSDGFEKSCFDILNLPFLQEIVFYDRDLNINHLSQPGFDIRALPGRSSILVFHDRNLNINWFFPSLFHFLL